jgi:hypothetical protein
LPGWFPGEPPINSIGGQVFGSGVAPEIGAIDLRGSPIAADDERLVGRCHGFAQLVSQYERCLVLDVEVAREGEHAVMSVFNRLARQFSSGFFISG